MSYDKIKKSLNGPVFPTITPFKDKSPHEVDYSATCDYIDFLYDVGEAKMKVRLDKGGLVAAKGELR